MHPADRTQVFYQCQRCGNCCRWPGFVRLGFEEVDRLAGFLGLAVEEFTAKFTDLHESRRMLVLKNKENGECVFYDGSGCAVQPVKPVQCAGFPNTWNFPGWRDVCEAIPVVRDGRKE